MRRVRFWRALVAKLLLRNDTLRYGVPEDGHLLGQIRRDRSRWVFEESWSLTKGVSVGPG